MKTRRAVALAGALLVGASAGAVHAADSDIYANRVPPALSQPMVMFSVQARTAQQTVYGGCNLVGAGAAMCAPAAYFRDNCPSCVLPTALASFTYYDAIRLSLRMALLQVSGVQVGLMLNHGQDAVACAGPRPALPLGLQKCSNGAYVAYGVKPVDQVVNLLTTPASLAPGANLAAFLAKLDNLPAAGTAPYQGKELFFELFRYLTGQSIYNGHNGYTDYGTTNTFNLDVDNAAASWDVTAENVALARYVSPLSLSLRCSRIYTINFLMDTASSEGDSDAAITAALASGGMDGINLVGANNKFSTVVSWMQGVDLSRSPNGFGSVPLLDGTQNVTSYFFVPPTPLSSNPPTFDATTTEYASSGGTTRPLPLGADPATLVDSLRGLLGQMVGVSTTFVAPSLPANAFNRAETLDSVYLALFQPDLGARPFWPGNVKKLKLKAFDTCASGDTSCTPGREVRMVDANNNDAMSSDGRIRQDALTFWTNGGSIAADPANGVTAGRDGRTVTLGGAGSRIPGAPGMSNSTAGARQLYLYATGQADLGPLNADLTVSAAVKDFLGVGTAAEALPFLTYIRGYDYAAPAAVRPWLMGDPMHSRPLPINYGALSGYSSSNPAIFIAVNTNDGFLHFIRNTTTSGAESGAEAWAFMPFEMFAIQQKLALNSPTPARVAGFDGVPTAYVRDVNGDGTIASGDGDRVWLYAGMRRGGRVQYALNVTDPTTPHLLWRIGNDTTDFSELGYTFSQPRVARVRTGTGTTRTAVLFGGGYDRNKDYSGTTLGLFENSQTSSGSVGTDDSMGNAIYVVDAETGALIWKAVKGAGTGPVTGGHAYTHAELKDSIPSALTVVDTDGDGNADRILVGDTGGNLWRADLNGNPADWTLTLVAQLGRHAAGASGKADDRRFFHEPDLVLARDASGPYDAIVIGSGDQEDPLDYGRARSNAGVETFTENGLYVIKDRRTAVGITGSVTPVTPAGLTDVSSDCLQTGASGCAPDLGPGWRLRMTATPGEKILSSALTAANRVYFTSYLPPDLHNTTTCTSSEGSGLFYTVSQADGTASFNYNTADGAGSGGGGNTAADRARPLDSAGIPSSPVYVNVADPASAGGEVKCVLASDLKCGGSGGATRFRTFWNRNEK